MQTKEQVSVGYEKNGTETDFQQQVLWGILESFWTWQCWTELQNEICYLLTTKGRNWKMPCYVLAVWFNLHRTEFCIKIQLSSGSPGTWPCGGRSRHHPSGCNVKEDESWDFGTGAGSYVDATEDPWKMNHRMYSCNRGASLSRQCQFSSRPPKDVYFWPLHGRSWNSDLYFKESWKIQICASICSNLQSSALSLGQKKLLVDIWEQIKVNGRLMMLPILSSLSAGRTNWSRKRPVSFQLDSYYPIRL